MRCSCARRLLSWFFLSRANESGSSAQARVVISSRMLVGTRLNRWWAPREADLHVGKRFEDPVKKADLVLRCAESLNLHTKCRKLQQMLHESGSRLPGISFLSVLSSLNEARIESMQRFGFGIFFSLFRLDHTKGNHTDKRYGRIIFRFEWSNFTFIIFS